jgi:prepilin-type N-terminal cleavage/methylation domain-containing protein
MLEQKGYSLIELLVAISIFSVIILITTQAIVLSLRSSRKGESLITVRENIDYAFGIMERHIRSAESIESCSSVQINYTDRWGEAASFSCLGGINGYIASGSAALRITSDEVDINCNVPIFGCNFPGGDVPSSVEIEVTGSKAGETAVEGASVSTKTRIQLRTY